MPEDRLSRFAHEAEIFACECLSRGDTLHRVDVERLHCLLPTERFDASGSSFISGAYSKGGIVGLLFNTRSFPASTTLLFSFLHQGLRVAQLLFS